ncbi:MAG: L-histidine N(alpha)-methyltransferase [Flavobacteriales bacterium]|jgi:dimethylhistidine N-methyltransferase|nr:L-histidine N(alpha)-methyltransferase [Flavobacteriales bacterium]
MNQVFAKDVKEGFSQSPKRIPSKYFYDQRGSSLFSEIMKQPEYYLTNAELEIFQLRSRAIIQQLKIKKSTPFELIELGAGDGYKTIEFLKVLENEQYQYQYIPIDISQKALDQIKETVATQLAQTTIYPKKGDYFQILHDLKKSDYPKVLFFLGSNIGNMEDGVANVFLQRLADNLSTGDQLVLGVDLKKSKNIVLPAYNDANGVTSAFNLNLLERINREFDANFDLSKFKHSPEYDEEIGVAKSSIQSLQQQTVTIKALDLVIQFEANEKIHTEISRKYNDAILKKITANTAWKITGKLTDRKGYFSNYIFEKQ